MKKNILLLLIATILFSPSGFALGETALPAFQDTPAYKQYQNRPKSEFSKILYLMDRFRKTPLMVIYDRVEYDSEVALKHAKAYVTKHYHKEDATEWIRENAYRSTQGAVIYVKYPDGDKRPLRDLLLEELQNLG